MPRKPRAVPSNKNDIGYHLTSPSLGSPLSFSFLLLSPASHLLPDRFCSPALFRFAWIPIPGYSKTGSLQAKNFLLDSSCRNDSAGLSPARYAFLTSFLCCFHFLLPAFRVLFLSPKRFSGFPQRFHLRFRVKDCQNCFFWQTL